MAFCPPSHSIFPFNLICFLLCVAHQVGPPPSFIFWFDSLNLWPTFRYSREPPFYCAHVGECIVFHNIVWDGFVSIVRDMGLHVSHNNFFVLLLLSFHYFHWWIDIVLFVDGTPTLANVVIIDPIQIDLVSYVVSCRRVAIIEGFKQKKDFTTIGTLNPLFFGIELTSCYLSMALAHWPMLSLPIPLESIWFHMLFCVTKWLQQ
jgi:hypothetical protein